MSLELAIKAGLSLISVRTNDTVYLEEILTEIIPEGKTLRRFVSDKTRPKLDESVVCYCTGSPEDTTEAFNLFSKHNTSLIVVNPEDGDNPAYYDAGIVPLPKALLYEVLSKYITERKFEEILPALGGLSLKQIFDLLMITEAGTGGLTAQSVLQSRLRYIKPATGLSVVDTDTKGYFPNRELEEYAREEKQFFLGNYNSLLRPKGLLTVGVPGSGKTAGARFVASEWGVPLFKLDTSVQSKWVGQSEQNLRDALNHLDQNEPCVVLLDEVEKMFRRGNNDAGVTDKLLSSLLWWMQERQSKVFVYMTCNDTNPIPPELYRAGRIDKKLTLDYIMPETGREMAKAIAKSIGFDVKEAEKAAAEMFEFEDHSDNVLPVDVMEKIIELAKDKLRH